MRSQFVSVYVDNGRILITQRGKANTLRRQLERKLGEVALPTHEAEAETDGSADQEESSEAEACHPETPEDWFRDGGANGFAYRSLCLCVLVVPPMPVGLLHSLPVHPTFWCPAAIPLELRAQRVTSSQRVVVLAFSDLTLQVQQQVYCSDACPQEWAAHAREWPLQEVERQLAWNERWRFKWTEGQPARSRASNNSNEQSNLDDHWAIEPDFPQIDPLLLAPSSWQLRKRGRYIYRGVCYAFQRKTRGEQVHDQRTGGADAV